MAAQLKYHRDAASLLAKAPLFSQSAADAIQRRERELRVSFPASVREWYSLDRAVEILRRFSNDDQPIPISRLGEPFANWYGGGRRDFVSQGLLLFLCENQGVCNWAVKLDGAPDPSVLVEVDTAPDAVWLPCAESFSAFIWCQIWDHPQDGWLAVSAQETDLSPTDLDLVRSRLQQLPTTHGWPGESNYRFQNRHGRVLIWDGGDRGVDWFVSARTAPDLASLLRTTWHCGGLARSLGATGADAARVLAGLRGGSRPTAT